MRRGNRVVPAVLSEGETVVPFRRLLFLGPLAVSLWVSGCHHPTGSSLGSGSLISSLYVPQDSPAGCLEDLRRAYVYRDPSVYASLLARDFTCVLGMGPLNPQNPMPEQWGIFDDSTSAYHMLTADSVRAVTLSFAPDPAVDSGNEYIDTWKAHASNIDLRVEITRGPALIVQTANGEQDTFYFKRYPEEHASNGRTLWRIWRWDTFPYAVRPLSRSDTTVTRTDWAHIKVHFR